MGRENHYLLLHNCVYIQIEYNKLYKSILEEEQVIHESQADCLLHRFSSEAEDLRNFTRKVGRGHKSHLGLYWVFRSWGSRQCFHDLLILRTLQRVSSRPGHRAPRQLSSAGLWSAPVPVWSLPICSLLALNPHVNWPLAVWTWSI